MTLRLGINPITWSNDDLQSVGGDIDLETCLADAAAAGYDGVELGHKFPRDAAALKPMLDEHGLALVSGWYSGRLLTRDSRAEIEAMRDHVALLAGMGCDVLIFAEVTGCVHSDPSIRLSQRPRIPGPEWKRFGERLSEVASACETEGLKLCYHHHMGTVVQSAHDIDALMAETSDRVFLLLDTGHALFAGADPVSLASLYGERIGHLHCKDIRPGVLRSYANRDSGFLDAVLGGAFTVPGDGCIDYPGVLSALREAGYSGWAVVEAEQDPSVANPVTYANLGYRNLRLLIEQYGT